MKTRSEFNDQLAGARRCFALGDFRKAEALYLELLGGSHDEELVLKELVRLYFDSKQLKKAVGCIEKLIAFKPGNFEYPLHLAQLSERLGLLDKSIDSYRRLLKLKPELPNPHYNLARLLKQIGEYQEAIKSYKNALKHNISNPEEVFSNLAVIYSELNNPGEAVSWLDKALDINPKYIPALFNLASIHEESGDKERALTLYNKILTLDSRCYPAVCRIAYMRKVENLDDPIIDQLKLAREDKAAHPIEKEEVYFALGKALDDCRQFDQAFESYKCANELGRARFKPYKKADQEQFVNSLMGAFGSIGNFEQRDSSDLNPIFICGMFRSGSTLLESILGRHSKITPGGELDFFPGLIESLGGKYPKEVGQFPDGDFAKFAKLYISYLKERFGDVRTVTDKRPDNFLHIGFIKKVFPSAQIVWTRRNLMDNCLSIYFQQLGDGMNYSVDLENIGHYYFEQIRLMEHWKSLFPESIFEVQYEKLVQAPEKEIRQLLGHLGLQWEAACLDFSAGKNYVKTASIWQVRESIHQRSAARYRHYAPHLKVLEKYLPL